MLRRRWRELAPKKIRVEFDAKVGGAPKRPRKPT
jgi:hypothetical protein